MNKLAPPCTGLCKTSFAYNSIKDRWPKILIKIVDQLHQRHDKAVNEFGPDGDKDIKHVIHNISKLRYLIVTDKPIENLKSDESDTSLWNDHLNVLRKKMGPESVTWFKTPWLFAECLVYRLLHQFFLETTNFKQYDPFRVEKEKGYHDGNAHMLALSSELLQITKTKLSPVEKELAISRHLQVSLWGNKADLSLTGGDPHCMADTLFNELVPLRESILVDDLDKVTHFLARLQSTGSVDIVLDNAGLELFTDLCLATVFISQDIAAKVVFRGKAVPWYVSDVTEHDFHWTIKTTATHTDPDLRELGLLWSDYVEKGRFIFTTSQFYTLGFPYCEMAQYDPQEYNNLSLASLIIFKGDLNYRKLVGDREWIPTTLFKDALCGFGPTNFVSLRTLKAETVAGLSSDALGKIEAKWGKKDLTWMVSSDYAVVQSWFKS